MADPYLTPLVAAAIGGTAAELTGGSFANGAVTAAFVHLFNSEAGRAWVEHQRSPQWARMIIPGQSAWDRAVNSFHNGYVMDSVGYTAIMLGEQVLYVLTLGGSMASAPTQVAASRYVTSNIIPQTAPKIPGPITALEAEAIEAARGLSALQRSLEIRGVLVESLWRQGYSGPEIVAILRAGRENVTKQIRTEQEVILELFKKKQ